MSVHPVTTAVTDARLAEILTARWSDGEHAHGSEIESCLLELQRLRASSTASEKRQDEAARLLRAVGAGGIFTLMAESSDDADVWYDQRDQFLEGK